MKRLLFLTLILSLPAWGDSLVLPGDNTCPDLDEGTPTVAIQCAVAELKNPKSQELKDFIGRAFAKWNSKGFEWDSARVFFANYQSRKSGFVARLFVTINYFDPVKFGVKSELMMVEVKSSRSSEYHPRHTKLVRVFDGDALPPPL